MNTDYMNFNFVGSLKLLTKKKMKRKEKKHKYKTQQNKQRIRDIEQMQEDR